jgi:hypothetical protein
VVASWPLDAVDAANRVRLAWLLTACTTLLRPGGCLILVVAVPAGTTTTPEDFTGVVHAAAGVGLGYLQHIVAVTADISDSGNVDGGGDVSSTTSPTRNCSPSPAPPASSGRSPACGCTRTCSCSAGPKFPGVQRN